MPVEAPLLQQGAPSQSPQTTALGVSPSTSSLPGAPPPSNLDCLVEACISAIPSPTPSSPSSSSPPKSPSTSASYVCDYKGCGRTFSKKWNLGAHLRLHTGERPFVCGQCGKKFMWKSSMKSHENVHNRRKLGAGHHSTIGVTRHKVLMAAILGGKDVKHFAALKESE